jgi:signal transduction histidine kinase
MFVVAGALLGLIALLGTLQYRWLGQISDAERDRMRASLDTRTAEFARDFDRELTRAYLLFQVDVPFEDEAVAERMAVRFDRWLATARFPRLLKNVDVVSRVDGTSRLQRLAVSTRTLEPVDWPPEMADWREVLGDPEPSGQPAAAAGLTIRRLPGPIWERVPAIVVPAPLILLRDHDGQPGPRIIPDVSYTILEIDRQYVTTELLPALAKQHLQSSGEGTDYRIAVVSRAKDGEPVYESTAGFAPKPDAAADAAVDLFQVRTQEFGAVAAEVRRFTTFTATAPHRGGNAEFVARGTVTVDKELRAGSSRLSPDDRIRLERDAATVLRGRIDMGTPLSIVVQQSGPAGGGGATAAWSAAASRLQASAGATWRLMVKHPSGSLEAAVNTARRRNLIVSSSILAILGASVGLLVLSTRRAQNLARQQMEFVAAVSHELRTPLAVIRSAGENLADGVVHDEARIRKYGDLVRQEGRRLTEMVEQILEFAGIHSGQRALVLRPVNVRSMLEDVVQASGSLLEVSDVTVEYDVADNVPPVLGDEPALRRVFQNLLSNAVKYGTAGRWIGFTVRTAGREVHTTVADRGIGIDPQEQSRIFDPFYRAPAVVAAQIQGAGLGLSLVRRIVEAHGGRITVQSAPGAGSAFTVVLPAAAEEPIGHQALPQMDARPSSRA